MAWTNDDDPKPPQLTRRERRKMRELMAHAQRKTASPNLLPFESNASAFAFLEGWLDEDADKYSPER